MASALLLSDQDWDCREWRMMFNLRRSTGLLKSLARSGFSGGVRQRSGYFGAWQRVLCGCSTNTTFGHVVAAAKWGQLSTQRHICTKHLIRAHAGEPEECQSGSMQATRSTVCTPVLDLVSKSPFFINSARRSVREDPVL